MNVIKEANKPSMKVTCQICLTELEIEASDLTAQGASKPHTLFLYICPYCKEYNGIHLHSLSPNMRKEVVQLFK